MTAGQGDSGPGASDSIRRAIEAADVEALAGAVRADPSLARALVGWGVGGKNRVPALHFVCDAVFRRLASQEQALAMAGVLLEGGEDPDRAYADSGDTFLIAAASLGAEEVGLRLVELGVDVRGRGLFRATALHWAAIMGLERLAQALLGAGARLELRDAEHRGTPLEWALHGWLRGTKGRHGALPATARVLVERGARVPETAAADLRAEGDAPMRSALGLPSADG